MNLVIIAHDLRSAHNVGSLLRTAEGLGAEVILSGYTPYPAKVDDGRLPHEAAKLTRQISKTALGAEASSLWRQENDIEEVLSELRSKGYSIAALEQSPSSVALERFEMPDKLAVILGREVEGITPELLALADIHLEIAMFGTKESFNVVQAAAMLMYQWRFHSPQ